jgi:hypothetical protein
MNASNLPVTVDQWILPATGQSVRLPAGWCLGKCRFERRGDGLVLNRAAGGRTILRGFYGREVRPDLRDEIGLRLPGELARLMAGLSEKAQELVLADGFGGTRRGTVA